MIAAEINTGSADFGHLGPMVEAVERELDADRHQRAAGRDADKRRGTRPGWDGGAYAFMRRVLETELGQALYRKRQEIVEPVFANTKFNRRFERFQRRGRAAATPNGTSSPPPTT